MALVLADRVEQVTRTTGLGDLQLAETIRGRQSFQEVTNNGDTVIYVLEDSEGMEWEIGEGTVVHGTETTLQRTTIRQSTNSDAKISLSAGTHRVFLVADAAYLTDLTTSAELAQAIADHEAAADPHPQYTTTAEAAAAAPVQSVNGETGTVLLDATDVGATPASHVGSGGAQHADATTSVSGFMSGADKTKLDGVEANAKDDQSAAEVPYSNATSGLTATDVQAALDEIDGQVDTNTSNIATNTSDIATNTSDIAERTIFRETVAEVEALSLPAGYNVYLTQDGKAGSGVIKSGAHAADPQKGIFIDLANGNYWERIITDKVYLPEWFINGATGAEVAEGLYEMSLLVPDGGTVKMAGVYDCGNSLPGMNFNIGNLSIIGPAKIKFIAQFPQGNYAFSGDNSSVININLDEVYRSNYLIDGVDIENYLGSDPDIQGTNGIWFEAGSDLVIRNSNILYIPQHSMLLRHTGSNVDRVLLDNVYINATAGINATYTGQRLAIGVAIDETNPPVDRLSDITLRNVTVISDGSGDANMLDSCTVFKLHNARNVKFIGCTFDGYDVKSGNSGTGMLTASRDVSLTDTKFTWSANPTNSFIYIAGDQGADMDMQFTNCEFTGRAYLQGTWGDPLNIRFDHCRFSRIEGIGGGMPTDIKLINCEIGDISGVPFNSGLVEGGVIEGASSIDVSSTNTTFKNVKIKVRVNLPDGTHAQTSFDNGVKFIGCEFEDYIQTYFPYTVFTNCLLRSGVFSRIYGVSTKFEGCRFSVPDVAESPTGVLYFYSTATESKVVNCNFLQDAPRSATRDPFNDPDSVVFAAFNAVDMNETV